MMSGTVEERLARLEAALGFARAEGVMPGELVPRRAAVLQLAASLWRCSVDDLTGRDRANWLIKPRAAVVWALRQGAAPLSFQRIGQLLGGRDHSTCINLHGRAKALRQDDAVFAGMADRLARLAARVAPFVEEEFV